LTEDVLDPWRTSEARVHGLPDHLSRYILHRADGRQSRGGSFFAVKPWRLATTSFQSSGPTRNTHTCAFGSSIGERLVRFAGAQIATVCAGLYRGLGHQLPMLNAPRNRCGPLSAIEAAMHRVDRVAAVPGWKARGNRYQAAVIRSRHLNPGPRQSCGRGRFKTSRWIVAQDFITPVRDRTVALNLSATPRAV
jgi:hypothetical protein